MDTCISSGPHDSFVWKVQAHMDHRLNAWNWSVVWPIPTCWRLENGFDSSFASNYEDRKAQWVVSFYGMAKMNGTFGSWQLLCETFHKINFFIVHFNESQFYFIFN